MRDDRAYLKFLVDSIDAVRGRVAPGRTVVEADEVLLDSVVRRLEVLADAAGHLSPGMRARHDDINWARVAGFRNRLAHGYLDLDMDLVWEVIDEDLRRLRMMAENELSS